MVDLPQRFQSSRVAKDFYIPDPPAIAYPLPYKDPDATFIALKPQCQVKDPDVTFITITVLYEIRD